MNINQLLKETAEIAASGEVALLNDEEISAILKETADALCNHVNEIIKANQQDLNRMDSSNPKYDRLRLTSERIRNMAEDMHNVARLASPLNKTICKNIHPNGMRIQKITVPFGVIGVIYEARPNVTSDVFSLCFKSGNACVLKGGSDADESNRAIVKVIHDVLNKHLINPAVCQLLPPNREATKELLEATGMVDLIIPRGSSSLIHFVRDNARIPVIETGAGICHAYFDVDGDLEKGLRIITNAKTRRVSVCNALDCLLIHQNRVKDLPYLTKGLAEKNVTIYADPESYAVLYDNYPEQLLQPANEDSFGTEFLDYKMSIKTVENLQEAMRHIAQNGSKHSECIISESEEAVRIFQRKVDAACVYANVPTSFTDGAQFGLGAEIGISTQKLHARGPMGLQELTTYKYIIEGEGQIRP